MYRLLILIPLVLGVMGCAGLPGLSTGAPDRDICVLTSSEVEEWMGYPGTTPQSEQGERGPTCGYFDEDFGTIVRLSLSPFSPAPCEELRNSANSQTIDGVGEWAYWSGDRQKMYVKTGTDCLEVTGAPVGDPDLDYLTSLTELARLAVSRL